MNKKFWSRGLNPCSYNRRSKIQNRKSLESIQRESKSTGNIDQPVVITREGYCLSVFLKKFHRREMERLQSSYWFWKRLQSTRQHRRGKLDQSQTTQKRTHFVSMRAGELACMNPRPNFVLDQPAGYQRFLPKRFGRDAAFGENMRERHRGVEIDQRSL